MSNVKRKHKIALIQFTRLGDIVQTLSAAKQVLRSRDDIEFHLIGRKSYLIPLKEILEETFASIHCIDIAKEIENSGMDFYKTITNLNDCIAPISSHHYDVVINLSYSKTSAYLTSLIDSTNKLGMSFDKKNNLNIAGKASRYVYANVQGTDLNTINLVDLFRLNISSENVNPINQLKKPESQTIAIHPFASSARKRWPAHKWAEIIHYILKSTNYTISILGSEAEKNDSLHIVNNPILYSFKDRMNNFVGKLSIPDTAKIIHDSLLFIGHDSLCGHLASLSQTQSLTISLGPVRPHETTPYGENNYVLSSTISCSPCTPKTKCDDYLCHLDIPLPIVNSSISQILTNGEVSIEVLENIPNVVNHQSYKLHKTKVDNKRMYLELMGEKYKDISDVFRDFYEVLFSLELFNTDLNLQPMAISRKLLAQLKKYSKGMLYFYELTTFGLTYSRYAFEDLQKQNISDESLSLNINKIRETYHLIGELTKDYPLFSPIFNFNFIEQSSIEVHSPLEYTESTFQTFEKMNTYLKIINSFIEFMISANEPKETTNDYSQQA